MGFPTSLYRDVIKEPKNFQCLGSLGKARVLALLLASLVDAPPAEHTDLGPSLGVWGLGFRVWGRNWTRVPLRNTGANGLRFGGVGEDVLTSLFQPHALDLENPRCDSGLGFSVRV